MSIPTGKLSKAMQELYDAMLRGVVVHEMSGLDYYCFRNDTMRHCTKQIDGLLRRGLVEQHNKTWRGAIYRPVKEPK